MIRQFLLVVVCGISASAHAGVTLERVEHGEYALFTPDDPPSGVLVVVHGMAGESETASDLAERFARRWTGFAETHDLIVVAPSFDEARYGRAYGGYRGLFGRDIGADEFVMRLVDRHGGEIEGFDGRFLLYGHSAGGQFACRFLLTHPHRVRAVVLSAPGRYAFPDADAPWPYGMGPFERTLDWGGGVRRRERVTPDPGVWLDACEVPTVVVVGDRDTDRQPERPAHTARTRVGLARQWVGEMRRFAVRGDRHPALRLKIVRGVGHNSARLTDPCREALNRAMREAGAR